SSSTCCRQLVHIDGQLASSTTATTATPMALITSSIMTTTTSTLHHHCDDCHTAQKDQPNWWPHRQRHPLIYARRPQ
ncbi:Os11g0567850, partial [Oryza sativa Japonica Group]